MAPSRWPLKWKSVVLDAAPFRHCLSRRRRRLRQHSRRSPLLAGHRCMLDRPVLVVVVAVTGHPQTRCRLALVAASTGPRLLRLDFAPLTSSAHISKS